ncbi:MAG: hypothetical protein Q9227_004680 [Pyrenula ochraceoflavens]
MTVAELVCGTIQPRDILQAHNMGKLKTNIGVDGINNKVSHAARQDLRNVADQLENRANDESGLIQRMADQLLLPNEFDATILLYQEISNFGLASSPYEVVGICGDAGIERDETVGGWVFPDWDGNRVKVMPFDDADPNTRPCDDHTIAFVVAGANKLIPKYRLVFCDAYFLPTFPNYDRRGVKEVMQNGLSPNPFGNILDFIRPSEFDLVHEIAHIAGGLRPRQDRRRITQSALVNIVDFAYGFVDCHDRRLDGRPGTINADTLSTLAQMIYMQLSCIVVNGKCRPYRNPTDWSKGMLNRADLTPVQNLEQAFQAEMNAAARNRRNPKERLRTLRWDVPVEQGDAEIGVT